MKKAFLGLLLVFLAACVFIGCKNEVKTVAVTGVKLDATATIEVGKEQQLTATVDPSNASNKNVTWSSTPTDIATVSPSGLVTGVKVGKATVTVTTEDGNKTATCTVTVVNKKIDVESVTLDKTSASLTVGDKITLTATVSPTDATEKTVTWKTSDEKVATVDGGKVTAVAAGNATITATADGKSATCAVTVAEAPAVKYLTLTASSGNVSVTPSSYWNATTKEYSTDGGANWKTYTTATEATILATSVMFRGLGGTAGSADVDGESFEEWKISGDGISVSGDIMTLLNYESPTDVKMGNYCFEYMFFDCSDITSIADLLLSASSLSVGCYYSMFELCAGLTEIPEGLLQATELINSCYCSMFKDCTGLTEIPEELLPATELEENCYNAMFSDCTSITDIPDELLPATTLADDCYRDMFRGCSGLTELPEKLLPVEALANGCYQYMFYDCTSLTTAPELPATTLTIDCYYNMFKYCSSLKITTSTDIGKKFFTCPSTEGLEDTNTLKGMFFGTSGSFKGTPTSGTDYYWY